MKLALTPRQAECLNFINTYTAENGFAPSYVNIAVALGLSPKSKAVVHNIVTRLVERGAITYLPGHARTATPIKRECCPNCGHVREVAA